MLEKALPEQTSRLEKHKMRIDKHNDDLTRYSCGLDKYCLPECPSRIELDEQHRLYKLMQQSHQQMRIEHESFHKEYLKKMQRVRDLTQRLIDEED